MFHSRMNTIYCWKGETRTHRVEGIAGARLVVGHEDAGTGVRSPPPESVGRQHPAVLRVQPGEDGLGL